MQVYSSECCISTECCWLAAVQPFHHAQHRIRAAADSTVVALVLKKQQRHMYTIRGVGRVIGHSARLASTCCLSGVPLIPRQISTPLLWVSGEETEEEGAGNWPELITKSKLVQISWENVAARHHQALKCLSAAIATGKGETNTALYYYIRINTSLFTVLIFILQGIQILMLKM